MLLLFLSIFVSSNGLSMSGNFGIFTLSKILNQSVLGSWVSMKLQTKMLHVWWKVENLTPLPFDWLAHTGRSWSHVKCIQYSDSWYFSGTITT